MYNGDNDSVPTTSPAYQRKAPKIRKKSTLPKSKVRFKRHDHAKSIKRKIKLLEIGPRPLEFIGVLLDD